MAIVCNVRIVTILERGYRVFCPPCHREGRPTRTSITKIHIEPSIQEHPPTNWGVPYI